jgi:hypothetical protein
MGGLDVRVDTYALGPTARLLAREFNVMNDKGVLRRQRSVPRWPQHWIVLVWTQGLNPLCASIGSWEQAGRL